jgi:hypothetical protein
MSRPLSKKDFRAVRIVLEPSDFLVGSDLPESPPKDLVSKDTWRHLVGLPDDVAIRTSNDYGGILKGASKFQSELVCVSIVVQELVRETEREPAESPISYVLCNATDDLAASIYNALTGYYGVAFCALRNVLENLTIGLHLELSNDVSAFKSWLAGNDDLGFGWAADKTSGNKTIREFEVNLAAAVDDNFFRQKNNPDPGGFARRLYGKLCNYSHGRPGFAHGEIWNSNGPVFVPRAFTQWAVAFLQVYSFCLIACRLAQPNLRGLGQWSDATLEYLFKQASYRLRPQDDGKKLFQNMPRNFW